MPDIWATVSCPVMGSILSTSGGYTRYFSIYFAYTKLKEAGQGYNCQTDIFGKTVCDYPVVDWCTPDTTPPDYQPIAARDLALADGHTSAYEFWWTFGECFKIPNASRPICWKGSIFDALPNVIGENSDASLASCTKR
jgi:hypothetical protein